MVDIEARQLLRSRAMNAIYDAADGTEMKFLGSDDVAAELGEDLDEFNTAVRWLDQEDLAKVKGSSGTSLLIQLTHRGIVEVERSRSEPDAATEHLSPYSSINITIHGNVTDSPMQVGSPGATQDVIYTSDDLGQIRHFVELFTKHEDELDFADDDARLEARAEVATVKAQLDSPKPKHAVIRVTLESLKLLVVGTVSSAAGAELLKVLTNVV